MTALKASSLKALVERKVLLEQLQPYFTPHAKQQLVLDALKAGCRKIFIRAGRQSGKTTIITYINWLICGLNTNQVAAIITPTLKQARKVYWKKRSVQDFGPRSWIAKEANDDLTLFFKNGSYLEIDGSDNIDSHRGDKKDFVCLDEFKDIDPRFYSEVIEPMFLTTGGVVVIIGTPPETPNSHFQELEEYALSDPSWTVIHWTSYDSPYTSKEWLDAKRAELSARGEDDVFRREYLAEYTKGGKNSVFPMFSESLHVKPNLDVLNHFNEVKDRCELYWLADPATSSTFGSLLFAYHREAGRLLFLDEIYAQDKSLSHTSAIVEQIKEKIAPSEPNIQEWTVVYDDAAVWFANELYNGHKIVSYPAKKQSEKKEDGISLFKDLLSRPGAVVISDLCVNLIKELDNYIIVNGQYPKKNDHLIDCIRYGLTFANVVLSLDTDLAPLQEREELYEDILWRLYEQSDLPGYLQ